MGRADGDCGDDRGPGHGGDDRGPGHGGDDRGLRQETEAPIRLPIP
jgi:hypothetical protein